MSLLTAYSPPELGSGIDLDLSKNECMGPDESLIRALPDPGTSINRYPDTTAFRQAIADLWDVPADRVLVTAGADDGLLRCFLSRVGPGEAAVATYPSFEMIPRYAAQAGGRLVEVPWWDGAFPVDDVAAAISGGARTAFVVSPNNPTGSVARPGDIEELAARASLVVLDAAYAEFADEDLTDAAIRHDNVVVLRTLSKAWGLAGLRVGYALGSAAIVRELAGYGNPYPVSGLSASLALMRLDARADVERYVARVQEERERLTRLLTVLGAQVLASQANFVLASVDDSDWVVSAAASLGIGLRRFPERSGLDRRVRIGLPGDPGSFARLTDALESILAPEAILFDLDGVLVDTERSQTAAIIETAASFGVDIGPIDAEKARAAGNANDDWELTWRLCIAGGAAVSLDDVTGRFEALYQGSPGRPGLKANERPLVDPGWLAALASRYPIAVVTGRPEADAREFLDRSGLGRSISTVVTREDAALKPDPEPVLLALERLGVKRAWMLGDTPDDVTSARAAGVLPLGVLAPGRDAQLAMASLRGAARVLAETTELEGLLP